MGYVFLLAIALTIAYRSTTAIERRKYLFAVLKQIDLLWLRIQGWWRELEPFRAALRERTRIAPVTPVDRHSERRDLYRHLLPPHLLDDPIRSCHGARASDREPPTASGGA
jgi:hypothetical protein